MIYSQADLLTHCEEGNLNGMIDALFQGADVNAKNDDGATILHLTCCQSNPTIIKLLIGSLGNSNANATYNDGNTPVHFVCRYKNDAKIVK